MGKEEDNFGNEEDMIRIFCHTYWWSWGASGTWISSGTNSTLKTISEHKTSGESSFTWRHTAPFLNASLNVEIRLLI